MHCGNGVLAVKKYFHDGRELTEKEVDELLRPVKNGDALKDARVAKTIRFAEGPRVLDVGCGSGAFDYLIAERHSDWRVVGTDVSREAVKIANDKLKLPNTRFEARDVLRRRFKPNSFDCVLFLEVIEHVDVPGLFLKEFRRVLKPGGCLVVSTPNAVSFLNAARHAGQKIGDRLKAMESEQRGTGTHLEHVAAYDVFTLGRLLDRNGFKYEAHDYARFSVPLSRRRFLKMDFLGSVFKPFSDDLIVKARKK